VRHAHATVLAALEWATRHAVPGARGWSLQEGVCGLFKAAGYATPLTDPGTTVGYVHGLGHGVGYELHEQPTFRKETGRDGLLAVGDVFTLEPGLYDPSPEGGYGIRLEDLFWLGPDGLENLTPLPYSMDPSAFLET
jgi:Xaa-Pro aminopeptidase